MDSVVALLLLALLIAVGTLTWFIFLRRRSTATPSVSFVTEKMTAIGELAAYKLFTKEIVQLTDHAWGDIGMRYFRWVLSERKMILIFDIQIEFRYDLRAPEFKVGERAPGKYNVLLPPCRYEVLLRDIQFYDEQGGTLMSWLLPGLIAGIPGGFGLDDRNRLIATARQKAEELARSQIIKLEPEIQKSASATLTSLARAFGAKDTSVQFITSTNTNVVVDLSPQLAA